MNFASLPITRSVLYLSDEALCIYKATPQAVELVDEFSWGDESLVGGVVATLKHKCNDKQIVIINDMVEQHYRKERVVKAGVGFLDRKNIVERKLSMAFPGHPARAAMLLKDKGVEKKSKIASDVYIFASVPETPQFTKMISVVRASLASVSGVGLLPVEAAGMVHSLAVKVAGKSRAPGRWTLFMGQHRGGGLRQIVTKDGELALTRMSPMPSEHVDHKSWADTVYQEYKATMSYLSRFGFQAGDGLDVILIAAPEAGHFFGSLVEDDVNYNHLDISVAAKHLGITMGAQDNMFIADPLYVAWIARKPRLVLPLSAQKLKEIAQPRQFAFWGAVVLALFVVLQSYQMVVGWSGLERVQREYTRTSGVKTQLESQYQQEEQRKGDVGVDLTLMRASLGVYADLEAKRLKYEDLAKAISSSLGRDMNLSALEIERPQPKPDAMGGGSSVRSYTARLEITYPSTVDIMQGNQEVEALGRRLSDSLVGHDVNVTKLLKDYVYSEEITVATGSVNEAGGAQDYVAEILIRGPVLEDQSQ